MPLLAPKDLSPEDRTIYRRWVGGLFATYAALLMMFCSFVILPNGDLTETTPGVRRIR